MKYRNIKSICLGVLLIGTTVTKAQVSIGDQPVPDTDAVLDLTNGNNLGLLLPKTAANPNSSLTGVSEGMLFYYGGNVFLRGATASFNSITPWKSVYTTATPTNVYFNPTGYTGVGIGIDGSILTNIKANLHVALNSKEVNAGNTSASLLIGDSDSGKHMSFDNDEIMVKLGTNVPDTLRLQEGGGVVQVGESQATQSDLNVFGKVQESGYALVPQGVIVMWSGTTANIPKGWALCDGKYYNPTDFTDAASSATSTGVYTKLTPNLTNKFIVGASGTYGNGGGTGGATTVTLATTNLPAHTHSINHDHPSHEGAESSHNHSFNAYDCDNNGDTPTYDDDNGCPKSYGTSSETVAVNLPNFVGTSGSTGSGTAFSIVPSYYALCYIMKL